MDALGTNETFVKGKYLEFATLGLYLFIFISGTFTNVVTICVILSTRMFRRMPFNILILYQTFMDLVACFLTTSVSFLWLHFSISSKFKTLADGICPVMVFLVNFGKISSLAGMSEIAVMRLICVLTNVNMNGVVVARIIKIVVLTNVVILTAFSVFRTLSDELNICTELPLASLWINITIIVLFFLIIITTYFWIAWKTKQQRRRIDQQRRRIRRILVERYDIATLITCVTIVAVFALFHLPLIVYGLVISKKFLPFHVTDYAFFSAFCWFSNVINPVIMFCTAKDFRQHVLLRFGCLRACCHRGISPEIELQGV